MVISRSKRLLLNVFALGLTSIVFFYPQFSHADAPAKFTLFINFPPAMCSVDPSRQKLRQCQEGYRMTVVTLRQEPQEKREAAQENCHSQEDPDLPPLQTSVLERVMPDRALRMQEWRKHGACSGMSAQEYFRTITNLSSKLRTPNEFKEAKESVFNHDALVQTLTKLNSGLKSQSVVLKCVASPQYSRPLLTEIRVCYDANANYGICPQYIHTNCPSEVSVIGSP